MTQFHSQIFQVSPPVSPQALGARRYWVPCVWPAPWALAPPVPDALQLVEVIFGLRFGMILATARTFASSSGHVRTCEARVSMQKPGGRFFLTSMLDWPAPLEMRSHH